MTPSNPQSKVPIPDSQNNTSATIKNLQIKKKINAESDYKDAIKIYDYTT